MNISTYLPEIPEQTKSALATDMQCFGSDALKLLGVYVASAGNLFSAACLVGAGLCIDTAGAFQKTPEDAIYRHLSIIGLYHDLVEDFAKRLSSEPPSWLETKLLESIQEDEMRRYEVNPDVWKLS